VSSAPSEQAKQREQKSAAVVAMAIFMVSDQGQC
jgi:hypothetical protein